MTQNSRIALVADIGGTNARFAIADIDSLHLERVASYSCASFSSLQAAVAKYLASIPRRPELASFAVAGPVAGETVRMTNRPWQFTREELREVSGARHLHLINDFEAQALSLPGLEEKDLHGIGSAKPAREGTKLVLGPGTGLGVAALAQIPGPPGWAVVAGEGGHTSLAIRDEHELDIARKISDGHVSTEDVVSGPGLAALYRVLAGMGAGKPARELTPAQITSTALAAGDPVAVAALTHFTTWLGRFAGDMALAFGARGGVYLGGGIAPRIIPALETGRFRQEFEAKGRQSDLVRTIPTYVVLARDAGLRGAAAALAHALARG